MNVDRLTEIFEDGQERVTGYQASINSDHSYIHKGRGFTALVDTGAITAVYHIAFTTPSVASGKFVHWRPVGVSTSAAYASFTMSEESSYTFAGGSVVTPFNRNRNIPTSSLMQAFYRNVTNAGTGTQIDSGGIGTESTTAFKTGGTGSANEELVLKPNTDYVISITPSAATTVKMKLFWYEEDYSG